MSDIVDRLGDHHEHPVTGKLVLNNPDGPEAADTIAALRAENERLQTTIQDAADMAEALVLNPRGPLWNYGTRPSAKDKVEWAAIKDTALQILGVLDMDRARAALDKKGE